MNDSMKNIFSGIQPSGDLTIGNYFGAIKNWIKLQSEYNCFFCIVDLHAITVRQEPKRLREKILETLAIYIASGIDPNKNTLFIQSHVPFHSELSWILNCFTYMGETSRMTQYKEKSLKSGESISVGLFTYPILMAADILLYNTDLVPVGSDQKQHLELARDLAERFNNIYSDTFKIPDPYISSTSSRIMNLQSPDKKMSKSDENENSYIKILDDENIIRKKISRSVTDSIGSINYSDDQLGIKNLINIFSSITGEDTYDIVARFKNKGYGDLKNEVSNLLIDELSTIQKRVKELMDNKDYLEKIYKDGAEKAIEASYRMLRKVKKKIGFI
ncbi:tryptophanyl-tRNA synthetase [Candidatus Arthromitus sp. SFB-rat-Yit]|nr:tryptophan--tRNA ligase [Candidatus Arthromitus sp. SFB-rat-Yit]BAK81724.1 tryptophanyl-tRNA synthetase [Candidatus Arthromitus sp. SFB-rat-Yit]